ncbi:MAG: LD-carboxypeptidase [Lyngbya sp.]|nr:LD-carboxypeptidase [Lyngbya sp.]
MIAPQWLKPGDRLRVITPSGGLRDLEPFEQGLEIWRSRGYHLELCSGYNAQWGYLAGTDQARRDQLLEALNDDDCRAVLCSRGGYGATRLLEGWQWELVKASPSPKFLIGFSDITALLWGSQGRIFGVHGPVLTTLAQEPDWSVQRLFDYLEGRPLPPLAGTGWGNGTVRGRLLPGNLTVATCLLGTVYQPQLSGVILAFEDVNEEPYRIDRMLTHWRMTGALQQVAGIALGRFSQWEKNMNPKSFKLDEVLRDRLGDLGIPVVSDLPFGHEGVNYSLPVGIIAELDGDRGILNCLPEEFPIKG